MNPYLIKIYHWFTEWKNLFKSFLDNLSMTIKNKKMIFGLHYLKWEIFYSFTGSKDTYSAFESKFYTFFNNFQLFPDDRNIWGFDTKKIAI